MTESTYTNGYQLILSEPLTKKKLIQLCHELKRAFNDFYNSTKFSFEPEPITEGGIVFSNYSDPFYKTMRISPHNCHGLYGWIPENVMEEWKENNDILQEPNTKLRTYLKSFHGAPLWTVEELKLFEMCFNKIGIEVLGEYPSKKSLITTTPICGDYAKHQSGV
jgi:hypothetical protein